MSAPSDSRREGAPRERLVLVLSPERSGSTLLSVMLGAHRRVVAPAELHLLRFSDFDAWREGYRPATRSLLGAYEELGEALGEADLERLFRGRPVVELYEHLLRSCGPARILIDKTPAYARDPDALQRAEVFRPFYVWLVRHPLGVARSRVERVLERRRESRGLLSLLKYPAFALRRELRRRTGRELRDELARWCDAHERIEGFLSGLASERWARVHYEDLVRAPEEVLTGLCARLGIAMEPGMLEPGAHAPGSLAWGVGDQKVRRHARVEASGADRWRERYSEEALDRRTRGLMQRIGVQARRTADGSAAPSSSPRATSSSR